MRWGGSRSNSAVSTSACESSPSTSARRTRTRRGSRRRERRSAASSSASSRQNWRRSRPRTWCGSPRSASPAPDVTERLLLAIALAHVAVALGLAALPLAPSIHAGLAAVIFGTGKATEEVRFLLAVFGPTIASWGVLFYALVRAFFRNPSKASWWALALSI